MHPSLNLIAIYFYRTCNNRIPVVTHTESHLTKYLELFHRQWNNFHKDCNAISHLLHFYDTTKKGAIKLRSTSDIFLPLSKPSPLADQLFFVLTMWNNAWIYYIHRKCLLWKKKLRYLVWIGRRRTHTNTKSTILCCKNK